MSIMQACAMVEAAVQRARSLFAAEPAAPTSAALGGVAAAAQSTAATGQLTREMSGGSSHATRLSRTRTQPDWLGPRKPMPRCRDT